MVNQNRGEQSIMRDSIQDNSKIMKCSLCGSLFDRDRVKTVPFCSTRCQQIDLGNWLNEEYGLPIESNDDLTSDQDVDE